jgi:plastocyanin
MRFLRAFAAPVAALLCAAVPPAEAAVVAGRIVLVQKGNTSADPSLDAHRAVVWFTPASLERAPAPVVVEMATLKKQFSPQIVTVPVGSRVRFPNLDPILHNVFSVSGRNAFDLGLVGKGPGKEATFVEAGVVRVFCNVHHAMFGHVVVVGTPHHVAPDTRGAFRLEGLPAGAGTLSVWHERGEVTTRAVTLPHAAPVEVRLEITQPRVPPHKNKFGKSYAGKGYG